MAARLSRSPTPLTAARHCSRSPVALATTRAHRCSCSLLAFAGLGDGVGLHRGGAGVAAAFAGVGDGARLHRGGAGLHAGASVGTYQRGFVDNGYRLHQIHLPASLNQNL